MRLIVDANILVGELLKTKGKELIADEKLELFIADKVWEEAQYELTRRVQIIAERGHLSERTAAELLGVALALTEQHITSVDVMRYAAFKDEAHRRIPQDPDDWHTVALALALNADIWTQDKDFLGCGVATWTSITLKAKLGLM